MTYNGSVFVENLKGFFEEKESWENPTKYEVIERFPIHGERRYTVYNLLCDIKNLGDDEVVIFYDAEEVLFEEMTRTLNAFLISSVKNVSYESKCEREYIVKFKFSSGYIEIREGKRNLRIA